jgi:flagellar basal-body rod protein FlgC
MNDFLALDLSAAGMRVQRHRMQIVAENLANQHTTGPDGPYQRKQAIIEAVEIDFEQDLQTAMDPEAQAIRTVAVTSVEADSAPPVRVYDPSHPDADAEGYVLKPNISPIREMTDMMEASRAYEANLAAARASQDMLKSAMDLIRG